MKIDKIQRSFLQSGWAGEGGPFVDNASAEFHKRARTLWGLVGRVSVLLDLYVPRRIFYRMAEVWLFDWFASDEETLRSRFAAKDAKPSTMSILIDASMARESIAIENVLRSAKMLAAKGRPVAITSGSNESAGLLAQRAASDGSYGFLTPEEAATRKFDLYLNGLLPSRVYQIPALSGLSPVPHTPRPIVGYPAPFSYDQYSAYCLSGGDVALQPDFGWRSEEYGILLALLRFAHNARPDAARPHEESVVRGGSGRLQMATKAALAKLGYGGLSVELDPQGARARELADSRAFCMVAADVPTEYLAGIMLRPIPFTSRLFLVDRPADPSKEGRPFDLAACARFVSSVVNNTVHALEAPLAQGQCYCFGCKFEQETASELGSRGPVETALFVSMLRNLLACP